MEEKNKEISKRVMEAIMRGEINTPHEAGILAVKLAKEYLGIEDDYNEEFDGIQFMERINKQCPEIRERMNKEKEEINLEVKQYLKDHKKEIKKQFGKTYGYWELTRFDKIVFKICGIIIIISIIGLIISSIIGG